ncbi:hypothetical protein HUB98_07840 [Paenibacillus barcinonensis]|uniref:Uncharacterized protein n=1 Tax=Paenibacillus barcinonensis TaxID=198119 RepID=A0A2V4WDK9_PAEBA|nr:hypothetical protein [Paenibacillus barcinonensis]PYE45684.1 hypothetical protein DFQ00_11727 [Paenibacillus barcinonensis]QKS56263.1 hypothetical protein HUB98_07840 [Paenibacillus barcinonensis]
MKPLTRKHSGSARTLSPPKPSSRHSVKNRSGPRPKHNPLGHSGSRQVSPQASVRGLAIPDRTSNQSSVVGPKQNTLDQLALVAAILALIASAIGLYIAWKTLILPSSGTTEITV